MNGLRLSGWRAYYGQEGPQNPEKDCFACVLPRMADKWGFPKIRCTTMGGSP